MKRIMLIEGNANIRKFIKRELSLAGYSVIEAADGSEAQTRIKEDKPEILIVDIHTKKKKALEQFKNMLLSSPSPPLIILRSKTPFEPDIAGWKPSFVLDRSSKTQELIKAIEAITPKSVEEKTISEVTSNAPASINEPTTSTPTGK